MVLLRKTMLSDVWGALMTSRKLWEAFGGLWKALGISRRLWEALGCSGEVWGALERIGGLWEALGSFGKLWEALGISGVSMKGLKKWTTRSIEDLLFIFLLRYLLKA